MADEIEVHDPAYLYSRLRIGDDRYVFIESANETKRQFIRLPRVNEPISEPGDELNLEEEVAEETRKLREVTGQTTPRQA